MKTLILSLMTFCLLCGGAMGQATETVNKSSDTETAVFYEIPVPSQLRGGFMDNVNRATTVETVEKNGVTYRVRVTYVPSRGPEKVSKLEINSDNAGINKDLKAFELQSGRPFNLGDCYINNRTHTGDWPALAGCTVDYVQHFIKQPKKIKKK